MPTMRAACVPQRMHCRLPRATGLSYPLLTEKVDILLSFLVARTGGHPVQFARYIALSEDTAETPSTVRNSHLLPGFVTTALLSYGLATY
jgi:hypothetical protein